MKLVTLAVAGFAVLGAGPALAQYGPYGPPPRPVMPVAGMPGGDVVAMVREMGLEPVGPPMRSGNFYVQRAADYYGKPMRVVVDARRAQVVSVEAFGAPGSIHGGPYAAASGLYAVPGPYGRRPYPAYGAMPPDDDEFEGPPAGQPMQQPQRAAPKAATKAAAVTPGRAPVPRKRPAAAPQETAGTVEPLTKPENAPAQSARPEAKPSAPAIPPVAPLE